MPSSDELIEWFLDIPFDNKKDKYCRGISICWNNRSTYFNISAAFKDYNIVKEENEREEEYKPRNNIILRRR